MNEITETVESIFTRAVDACRNNRMMRKFNDSASRRARSEARASATAYAEAAGISLSEACERINAAAVA